MTKWKIKIKTDDKDQPVKVVHVQAIDKPQALDSAIACVREHHLRALAIVGTIRQRRI